MHLEEIKELIELLKDTDITDLQVERDGTRVRLKRERMLSSFDISHFAVPSQPVASVAQPAAAPAAPAEKPAEDSRLVTVTAPLVGTFYRSPSPEASHFIEIGDRVTKGQVICIVEAMKLMNEIEVEVSGVVVKALVENGQPVEYGEPLFLIDPS